jgi:class 3 adenylate cyclase
MHLLKKLFVRSSGTIVAMLGRLSFAAFLIVVAAHAAPSVAHLERYKLLYRGYLLEHRLEAPVASWLRANLPMVWSGVDATPLVIAVAFLVLWTICDYQRDRFALKLSRVDEDARRASNAKQMARAREQAARAAKAAEPKTAPKPAPAEPAPKPRTAPAEPAAALPPMPTGEQLSDREHLLELYARAKKSLEEQKKHLAFLAIDVVDSTGMKRGEDSALAERDFRQYKKIVERQLAEHRALKAAWTPDGVMICFPTVPAAVAAAQGLIRELDRFNREVKTITAEFRVRCGINAGRVMFDEAVRMEEMADRTIDIAGHMQKYAEPNSIYLDARVLEGLDAHGFRDAKKQVDGCDVYEWRPDAAAGRSAAPPSA